MSSQATAKNWPIGKAPKRISLLGDATVRPESAEHIIEFPGGAIEVSRTTNGDHWAHIIVNHRDALEDGSTRERVRGEVVDSRIGRTDERRIDRVPEESDVYQIAVLIRSSGGTS